MTSLTLAPWERTYGSQVSPVSEEPCVHSIPWNGESVPFLFQYGTIYSRPYVFARPVESQDVGNWLVCEVRNEYRLKSANDKEHLWDIVSSLCERDGRCFLARFCVVDERFFIYPEEDDNETPDPGNCVVLFEDGEGNWLGEWRQALAQFGFSIEPEAFRNDGRAVAHAFDEWMVDADSDVIFARRWNMMPNEKKMAILLGGKESRKQIEAVMRWTLLCETLLWQSENEWIWVLNYQDESHVTNLLDDLLSFRPTVMQKEFPLLFRIQNFLLQHHIPGLCSPIWKQRRCTQTLPKYQSYEGDEWECYAAVEVRTQPSSHECLEARLQLRDWLEQNAYPDELEAIKPLLERM